MMDASIFRWTVLDKGKVWDAVPMRLCWAFLDFAGR
jgi:hypothetical protein